MDDERIDPEDIAAAFLTTHLSVDDGRYLGVGADGKPCGCALGSLYMRDRNLTEADVLNMHDGAAMRWAVDRFGPQYVNGINKGFAAGANPTPHVADHTRTSEGYVDGVAARAAVERALKDRAVTPPHPTLFRPIETTEQR